MVFRTVTIVGCGLIGSSLMRAIRQNAVAEHIIAVDHNLDVCRRVEALGIADVATTDLRKSVEESDLILLCVPPASCGKVAADIRYALREGAIVSDVASVKGAVVADVLPHIPKNVHFIPAHPIAGTENSGPEAGFASLFEGRWCIITPLPDSDIQAVEKVTTLWERCGSLIEIMDVARHDLVLGITSHLPHLIAYTIVGTANELEEDTKNEVIKFSASGFRDFTRIAASDPVMWRDIFLNNKEAILEILQRFNEDLTAMQKAIRKGDGDYLVEKLSRTRAIRRRVIKEGQAEDPPGKASQSRAAS